MAQSNWNFILKDANTFVGGTSGSAIQHSTLSNPLTSSGDWCRGFIADNANGASREVAMIPINNSELTSSSGYEYGYAYSLRYWSRVSVTSANRYTAICFKAENNLSIDAAVGLFGDISRTGYYLQHSNANLDLYCRVNESVSISTNSPDDPSVYTSGFKLDNIVALTNNTWHRIRMDVTPSGPAYDRIIVYTATQAAPDTWVLRSTTNIPRLKTGAFIPWANNPNGDGASASGKGYMGIAVGAVSQTDGAWIDGFEVYKERVVY